MLILHILLHKLYCAQSAQNRGSKCKAWPKRRQNASSSMNMSNTSNYARTGPTQQKFDRVAYFTAYALLSFDLLRHAHDIKHCHLISEICCIQKRKPIYHFKKLNFETHLTLLRLLPGFSVHGCAHWQCEHLGRLPNITHITLPRLPQSPPHTTLHCVTVKPNNVIFWALVICSAISSRNSREVGSFWVVVVAKVSINSRNSRNIGEDHFENHLGLRLPLCHHQDYHKLTKSLLLSSSSSPSPS